LSYKYHKYGYMTQEPAEIVNEKMAIDKTNKEIIECAVDRSI